MDDPPRRRPRALGAFIFAGGFHVGVSQHFDLIAHLEGDGGYGTPTVRLNFPELPIYHGPANWPLAELKAGPEIDFIYGNPPCAAWSGNNPNSHVPGAWKSDPRVNCSYQHFGLLEELRPKVWAWESVTQAPAKGAELVAELTQRAMALGYSVTQVFHDAQWLGTPQIRKRWFLVAHRVKVQFRTPNWAPPTSAVECLETIAPRGNPVTQVAGTWKGFNLKMLKDLRPGERLAAFWERTEGAKYANDADIPRNAAGNISGRPAFGVVRVTDTGPSSATVGYGMIHPKQHRFLTVNEVQALAGFPDDYVFEGRGANELPKMQLIARGVMPPVAAWLAASIKDSLELNQPVTTPEATVVDFRLPPPAEGAYVKKVTAPAVVRPTAMKDHAPPPPTAAVPPRDGDEKSGVYIRRLLTLGFTADPILEAVHAQFPGSKASKSDISWNRAKLAKEGFPVKAAPLLPPSPSAKTPKYAVPPPPTIPTMLPAMITPPWEDLPKQPTQRKTLPAHVDPNREFDTTSLKHSDHGRQVHRDYGAHFFRWGFAGRFIKADQTEILDVGCGEDTPLLQTMQRPRNMVPKRYVGVDFHKEPAKYPHWAWATFHWNTNFIQVHKKLGQFDLVTNFEVIEHMSAEDGLKLLKAMKACLKPDGKLLLSTPVFNGKAAANHIHEYTIEELAAAIHKAGLRVVNRFGTFANSQAIKKVAKGPELDLVNKLKAYYSDEVLSCFLAPLYPDASRNNCWLLTHR
jgi:site-specific DNA-cytosine methylase/2-polyprenyl-3-methyl-5-hydroxy-6-metoxy-1,4-benzoquinol methylase